MKTKIIIFFLIITGVVIVSCEKENEPHETFEVIVDEEFDINLKANWSAGYHWSWSNSSENKIVDTVGLQYLSDGPLLGDPNGTEKWLFKALQSGTQILEFQYSGPEDDAGIEETCLFEVIVK